MSDELDIDGWWITFFYNKDDEFLGWDEVGRALWNDDEWSDQRITDWAEALLTVMPLEDGVARIELRRGGPDTTMSEPLLSIDRSSDE
jgi:hypothetical protein